MKRHANRILAMLLTAFLAAGLFPAAASAAQVPAPAASVAQVPLLDVPDPPAEGQPVEAAPANAWIEPEPEAAVMLKEPVLADEPDGAGIEGEEVSHTRNSRTYLLDDGESYVARVFSEPITYGEGASEADIDNTLVRDGQGYTNAANSYSVRLPREGAGITIESGGKTLEITPLFGALSNAVVLENAIRYNGVAAGVDLQYTAFGGSVEEEIILSRPIPDASFSYALRCEGVRFALENGIVHGYAEGATEPVFTVSAPAMTDASGELSQEIALLLEETDAGMVLTAVPSAEWLAAPERAYPVRIDPEYRLIDEILLMGFVHALDWEGILGASSGPAAGTWAHFGPNVERRLPFLFAGLETGGLSDIEDENGLRIGLGESWSYIRITDFSQFVDVVPEGCVLTATLRAYKYSENSAGPLFVDAKMIAADWHGAEKTWNNRPRGGDLTDLGNGVDASGGRGEFAWDISAAFTAWKNDPSTNLGIMFTPRDESQEAVVFAGPGNPHTAANSVWLDLSWTVPNPVDENMPLDAPAVNLRPLTYKNGVGMQNVTGLFADGVVRPGLRVDYRLNSQAAGAFPSAGLSRTFPNSDLFSGQVPFTLGYVELYESNWQTSLFRTFFLNTVYNVYATASGTPGATPEGRSDDFVIYQFREQDTLPYVARHYGVTRDQLVLDNRTGDDLAMPGNTIFVRSPQQNATVPYTRPDDMTLEHKRAIIYANMGRSQMSEFDIEPVNMNTGNFYLESVDAENTEYQGTFPLARTYNSIGEKTSGAFGPGWSFEYQQTLTGRADGGLSYHMGDGKQIVFPRDGTGWGAPAGYALALERVDADDPHDVRYEIRDADGKAYIFDSYGILRRITDAIGLTTTIEYDGDYSLLGVLTGSGRHYSFTTNSSGQITSVTLPNSGVLRYEYTDGCLTAFTNADGDTVRYAYDDRGQMSEWHDGNGHRVVKNEYDGEGRVIRQTDGGGGVSTLAYSDESTTLTDAENNVTVYEHDSACRTTRIDPADNAVEKTFNAQNQLATVTDKAGNTTVYQYDANGNITRETRADGAWREVTYNAWNKPERIREFDGTVVLNTYDAQGNVAESTGPDGDPASYAYDQYGRTTSITDSAGTTIFSYSGLDRLTVTYPDGTQTACYYDAMGRLVNEVDALGVERKTLYSPNGKKIGIWQTGDVAEDYLYDGAGNCIGIVDANGGGSTFAYNAQNQLTRATDPLGAVKRHTYDRLGRKLTEEDALGAVTSYEYDALGQLVKTTDALGNSETSEYDQAGRLITTTDKNGNATTYEYDAALGLRTAVLSPSGATRSEYDAMGRLVRETGLDGHMATYEYDSMGRVLRETDASGLSTEYVYGPRDVVAEIRDNAGRITRNEYDSNGNLTRTTDPLGRESVYEYDAANRLVRETAPGGATLEHTYDSAGNRTRTTQANGSADSYEYDKMGHMTAHTDANGNRTEYRFDAVGNLRARIDALGGTETYVYDANQVLVRRIEPMLQETEYVFDAVCRLTEIIDPNGNASTIEYDAAGNITAVTAADGGRKTSEYDAANRVVKETYPEGYAVEFQYDAMGRVAKEWDNDGGKIDYEYDMAGRITQKTDALDRTASYFHDLAGNLTRSIDFNGDTTEYAYDLLSRTEETTTMDGRSVSFAYDAAGNMVSQTDADGRGTSYEYDAVGHVAKETDAAGNATSSFYDPAGNLVKTVHPDMSETAYEYDAAGRMSAETDANGNRTEHAHDAAGRTTARTDPDGGVWRYEYDPAGNRTKTTDPLGAETLQEYDSMNREAAAVLPAGGRAEHVYDAAGRVVSETDAAGARTEYAYSLDGDRLSQTDPNGLVTTYVYDAEDRIVGTSDSAGRSSETTYDAAGNVSVEADQNGAVSTFEYDEMHRVVKATDPNGAISTFLYDARGNLRQAVLPTGAQLSYAYDSLDRVLTGSKSLTAMVAYAYDAMGRVIGTRQDERVSRTEYDSVGNVLEEQNALGDSVLYAYDAKNQPVSFTDCNGNTSTTEYDLLGRAVRKTNALGDSASFAYDAAGNMIRETDETGEATWRQYDSLGRLTGLTDALGRGARYAYDEMGNLTESAIGGQTTAYRFDLHGNLAEILYPDATVEAFAYDASSRLRAKTKADGKEISYDYDLLGALLRKDYGDEQAPVTYGYDSTGRKLAMEDEGGETSYGYDVLGRLVSVTSADGKTLSYAYDRYGRVASVRYPEGKLVSYAYDAADRLTAVRDSENGETAYAYDKNGNVLSCQRPGGLLTEYAYDAADRLTSLANSLDGSALSEYAYAYDAAGRIVSEDAVQEGQRAERSFGYDAAGQLETYTEESGGNTTLWTYAYNEQGNRVATARGDASQDVEYEYGQYGRLASTHDANTDLRTVYEYDVNGNLVRTDDGDAETVYAYDVENRLKAVREGGALLMAASYDGDGNRTFQIHRTLVPFGVSKDGTESAAGAPEPDGSEDADGADGQFPTEDAIGILGRETPGFPSDGNSLLDALTASAGAGGGATGYYEKVYPDAADSIFWFGFGQGVVQYASGHNRALGALLAQWLSDAWDAVTGRFSLVLRGGMADAYSEADIAAMGASGLSEKDIDGILYPSALPTGMDGAWQQDGEKSARAPEAPAAGKANPAPGAADGKSEPPGASGTPILIPAFPGEGTRVDYELTYYLNDVSMGNVQAAAEYGRGGEQKNAYVYGLERLTADGPQGVETYLYDGRGSVAQTVMEGAVARTLSYDAYGNIRPGAGGDGAGGDGAGGDGLLFAYNAEEYNPVTNLQYLRARYYSPTDGMFLTRDSVLGDAASVNSQNRYSYAENDPANNADPSGHSVGGTEYERIMEENGGINEIYNYYVGATLQNHASAAASSFYRQYAAATEAPYQDRAAVQGINEIPAAVAGQYIDAGIDAALAVGQNYGCAAGAVTNAAIGQFVSDVNTSRNSVNQQINDVKEDKLAQNARYAASVGKGGGLPIGSGGGTGNSGSGSSSGSGNSWTGDGVRHDQGANPGSGRDICGCASICKYESTCHCGNTKWGITSWFVDRLFAKNECQGIWYTTPEAWQKYLGYTDIYDVFFQLGEFLTYFSSIKVSQYIFKSWFNADGKYWRVEGWKGNYLNMGVGAELGVYQNSLITMSIFFIPKKEEWPAMEFTLSSDRPLFTLKENAHWWLSGFRPGIGTIAAKDLTFNGSVTFKSMNIAETFIESSHWPREGNFVESFLNGYLWPREGNLVLSPVGDFGVNINWT